VSTYLHSSSLSVSGSEILVLVETGTFLSEIHSNVLSKRGPVIGMSTNSLSYVMTDFRQV